jgi:hypothetical protein
MGVPHRTVRRLGLCRSRLLRHNGITIVQDMIQSHAELLRLDWRNCCLRGITRIARLGYNCVSMAGAWVVSHHAAACTPPVFVRWIPRPADNNSVCLFTRIAAITWRRHPSFTELKACRWIESCAHFQRSRSTGQTLRTAAATWAIPITDQHSLFITSLFRTRLRVQYAAEPVIRPPRASVSPDHGSLLPECSVCWPWWLGASSLPIVRDAAAAGDMGAAAPAGAGWTH